MWNFCYIKNFLLPVRIVRILTSLTACVELERGALIGSNNFSAQSIQQ